VIDSIQLLEKQRLQQYAVYLQKALEETDNLGEATAAAETALALDEADGIFLGLVKGEWHGPNPPGEGWVLVRQGPRGGKVWKKSAAGEPTPEVEKVPRKTRAQQAQRGEAPPSVMTPQEMTEKLQLAIQHKALDATMTESFKNVLMRMRVKDIHELKRNLGLKASGTKEVLINKLLERSGFDMPARPGPQPPQPTPAPKPEPAKKKGEEDEDQLREFGETMNYQRPAQKDKIDRAGSIDQRLAQYKDGDNKVKALADLHDASQHYEGEHKRLQAAIQDMWTKGIAAGDKFPTFSKKERDRMAKLRALDREAQVKAAEAATKTRELLKKSFHAETPADFQYHVNDRSGVWKDDSLNEIKEARNFLGALLQEDEVKKGLLECELEPIPTGEDQRSYFSPGTNRVSLKQKFLGDGTRVTCHESMHYLEEHVQSIGSAAQEFLSHRIGTEAPVSSMRSFPV